MNLAIWTRCVWKNIWSYLHKSILMILHIIQLDNGPLHQSLNMSIPENIIFLFQPPYSPELNPIERLWLEIKRKLKWEIFENLDELRKRLTSIITGLTSQTIESLGGWDFILKALLKAGV